MAKAAETERAHAATSGAAAKWAAEAVPSDEGVADAGLFDDEHENPDRTEAADATHGMSGLRPPHRPPSRPQIRSRTEETAEAVSFSPYRFPLGFLISKKNVVQSTVRRCHIGGRTVVGGRECGARRRRKRVAITGAAEDDPSGAPIPANGRSAAESDNQCCCILIRRQEPTTGTSPTPLVSLHMPDRSVFATEAALWN